MRRVRAADDFEAIRLRLEELRRDRAAQYGGKPAELEASATPHQPSPIIRRALSERRQASSR